MLQGQGENLEDGPLPKLAFSTGKVYCNDVVPQRP